jgi:hypothetical protein
VTTTGLGKRKWEHRAISSTMWKRFKREIISVPRHEYLDGGCNIHDIIRPPPSDLSRGACSSVAGLMKLRSLLSTKGRAYGLCQCTMTSTHPDQPRICPD